MSATLYSATHLSAANPLSHSFVPIYSSIRFPLTAIKWYSTIQAIAATPRPLERLVRVVSEIMVGKVIRRGVLRDRWDSAGDTVNLRKTIPFASGPLARSEFAMERKEP